MLPIVQYQIKIGILRSWSRISISKVFWRWI